MKRYFWLFALTSLGLAQQRQWVEGFDSVEFHYNAHRENRATRDFRGMAPGFMTAGWWAPGQMKNNYLSWKTASVPAKNDTTFAFIAAHSPLPSEFARGPEVRLSINGRYALTFTLGFTRDYSWKEGEYELKYLSKRVEFPYFGSHRQFELHGNSGLYQFSVPASAVEAGRPAVLKVELKPFAGWNNGWFMVKERRDVLTQTMDSLEGEIEALRQDVAHLTQLTHILATQHYSSLIEPRSFEHRVLYSNGFRHLHPADILRLQNGELLLMSREATEHIANDGDVIMLRSKDGGNTWGEKQVIAGIKDVDEREGCGLQLRDGTIVVGIFYNGLYKADGDYNWAWRTRKFDEGKQYLGAYVITSNDNGRTWSGPNYVDTKGMPFSDVEGPTDAPVEMPDGSILMALTGYNVQGDMRNYSAVLLKSVDKGKSWKYFSTMASDPGGRIGGFTEPGLVRTRSGRLIVALRNEAPENAVYSTYSDDNGLTWAPVRKTPMHGHPVDLIQLSDGRVMATYGIRPRRHADPGGIRACFSRDNGETWDILNEVQLRNDFVNLDIGYPESLEMPDGRVLTVYYYNLFQRFFLGGTFWKP